MSLNTVKVDFLPACDFCTRESLADDDRELPYPARYDGATILGPWAFMCDQHMKAYGLGLGLGVGQRLELRTAGDDDA